MTPDKPKEGTKDSNCPSLHIDKTPECEREFIPPINDNVIREPIIACTIARADMEI
jgi:hypothetical protein